MSPNQFRLNIMQPCWHLLTKLFTDVAKNTTTGTHHWCRWRSTFLETCFMSPVAGPGFRRGGANSKGVRKELVFGQFSPRKLHETKRYWTKGACPWRSPWIRKWPQCCLIWSPVQDFPERDANLQGTNLLMGRIYLKTAWKRRKLGREGKRV